MYLLQTETDDQMKTRTAVLTLGLVRCCYLYLSAGLFWAPSDLVRADSCSPSGLAKSCQAPLVCACVRACSCCRKEHVPKQR